MYKHTLRSIATLGTLLAFVTTAHAELTDPALSFNVLRGVQGSSISIRPNNFSGAFEHTVPIVVPQGRNGLTPELALTRTPKIRHAVDDTITG